MVPEVSSASSSGWAWKNTAQRRTGLAWPRRADHRSPEGGGGIVRVAHISDCFVPRLGGIEMQVNDLTRRQQQAGHRPEVLTATPLPRRMAGRSFQVPIHRSGIPIPAEIANNPIPSRPIRRTLLAGDYDLVHVHAGVGSPFAAAGVRVALELGLPVAVTVHCLPASFRLPDILTPWATPDIARRIALSAVSEAAARPLRERTGVDVTVVPNGLDPQDWAVRPAAADSPITLRLTVFGDGKLMPRMRRYVRRHGMTETVRLAGRVDRAELT